MTLIRRLAAIGLLVAATLDVRAAQPTTGLYRGVGVGQSRYSMGFANQVQPAYDNTVFTVTQAGMGRTHATAYHVFGGYQFSPYVAIEGGWQDLGSVNGDYELRNAHGDTFSRNARMEPSGVQRDAGRRISIRGTIRRHRQGRYVLVEARVQRGYDEQQRCTDNVQRAG